MKKVFPSIFFVTFVSSVIHHLVCWHATVGYHLVVWAFRKGKEKQKRDDKSEKTVQCILAIYLTNA